MAVSLSKVGYEIFPCLVTLVVKEILCANSVVFSEQVLSTKMFICSPRAQALLPCVFYECFL